MSDKLRAQKEMCKQHCFTVRKNFAKRTNEKIKRKALQIVKLQAKLDKSKVADKNLMLLQKRYNRFKNTHKAAKVELSNSLSLQKKVKELEHKLSLKDKEILKLQNDNFILEEKVQEMVAESKKQETKEDGRTYSPEIRMMVFDAIVAQVPTYNITELITKISRRCGVTLIDVP